MTNQCMKRNSTLAVSGECYTGSELQTSIPVNMLKQRKYNLTVTNSSKNNAPKSLIHCWCECRVVYPRWETILQIF